MPVVRPPLVVRACLAMHLAAAASVAIDLEWDLGWDLGLNWARDRGVRVAGCTGTCFRRRIGHWIPLVLVMALMGVRPRRGECRPPHVLLDGQSA